MISTLSPAMDTAANASALAAANDSDAVVASPFSAVIKSLKPAAAPAADSELNTAVPLSSPTADILKLPEIAALPTKPSLTNAGRDDLKSESHQDDARLSAPDALPLLPLQPAILPAAISVDMPAQIQAQQWLAALAPATTRDDASPSANAEAVSKSVASGLPVTALPTPISTSLTNGWLAQPLNGAFFKMTSALDITPAAIRADAAISLDGLVNTGISDLPRSGGSALSIIQQLGVSTTSAPVLMTITPHAQLDPAWSDAFGQRVAMLAQQGTQSAILQLNPQGLGPIQVRIAMSEQGARVEFNTLQQTTSDLIKSAMPRLAAALEHQGLRLDESRVNVLATRHDVFNASTSFSARQDSAQNDGGRGQQAAQQSGRELPAQAASESEARARQAGSMAGSVRADSGIDYYA